MTGKEWLIKDLRDYERLKAAETQIASELETLKIEETLQASRLDRMPSAGGNTNDAKLVEAIAKQQDRELCLELTRRKIADLDRLLQHLSADELFIIDKTDIHWHKGIYDELAEELEIDIRQVYNRRDKALNHLAVLRYGAGYRPKKDSLFYCPCYYLQNPQKLQIRSVEVYENTENMQKYLENTLFMYYNIIMKGGKLSGDKQLTRR